jgi:hypothetical protein
MTGSPPSTSTRATRSRVLELVVRRRRAVEIDDLCWSDTGATCSPPTRATTPARTPRSRGRRLGPAGPARRGGTPRVRELTLCELGVAPACTCSPRGRWPRTCSTCGHRLPRSWEVFLAGGADAWLVRRVASMTRELSPAAVAVVDTAAAAAARRRGPGPGAEHRRGQDLRGRPRRPPGEGRGRAAPPVRVPDPHRRDRAAPRHRPGHRRRRRRTSTPWSAGVADLLAQRPEHAGDPPRPAPLDRVRVARPTHRAALRLLPKHTDPDPDPAPDPDPGHGRRARAPRALAFPADLLAALALDQPRPGSAPAQCSTCTCTRPPSPAADPSRTGPRTPPRPWGGRVEGLGPHALSQLTELLGHTRVAVQAGDRPGRPGQRQPLRTPPPGSGNASTCATPATCSRTPPGSPARSDLGPPHRLPAHRATGQTGTRNGQPLGRTGHRAKTHLGYQCTALPDGAILWRSPHGLHRLVDRHGTHPLDPDEADALTDPTPAARPGPPHHPPPRPTL